MTPETRTARARESLRTPPPRELGFRMPAEWEPHAATWTSWPFDDVLWCGHLEGVRREFAALVGTITCFEPVRLLVRDDEAERDARGRLGGADVTYQRVALDDVWFRDNGPIFVRNRSGEVSFVHWAFNAWGGKFEWTRDTHAPTAVARALALDYWKLDVVLEGGAVETNGDGVALTTRSCLLSPTRNPELGEAGTEHYLREYLGIETLYWLDRGLDGDHTDGHIDTVARFTDPRTIVCSVEPNAGDPNHAATRANLERLRSLTAAGGPPYRIVEVPLPANRLELEGERLAPAYVNFYMGNGFVVVPQYADPNDARALETLRPLFPGREVIALASLEIMIGGGSFHCLTQPQPAGRCWTRARA